MCSFFYWSQFHSCSSHIDIPIKVMNNDVFLQRPHLIKCQITSIACSVPVWRVSPFTARHRPFRAVSSTAARSCSTACCPLTACFLRRSLEAMWMSHSANTPPADFPLYTVHCTPGREQSSAKVQYQRSFWAIPASAANAVQGLAQQCSANQWNARFRWQSLQCKLFESDTLQSILALSANGSSFQMDHLLQSEAIASNQPPGP